MSKQEVLVISTEPFDCFDPLFDKLKTSFSVKIVDTIKAGADYLQSKSPKAIVVTEATISTKKYNQFLLSLVEYVKQGGILALAGFFSGSISMDTLANFFKNTWGVPWTAGSYHRTDFACYPNSVLQLAHKVKLPTSYSMKALHLKGVESCSRVYVPAPNAKTQSLVFAREFVSDFEETAIAFHKIGEGYIGYIGDVNLEKESDEVVLRMCQTPTTKFPATQPQQAPPQPPKIAPQQQQTTTQKPLCRFFAMGTCKFGPNCRFAHALPQQAAKPASPATKNTNKCGNCGKSATLKCSRCKIVFYCSQDCQKAKWGTHKLSCKVASTETNTFANMFKKPLYEHDSDDNDSSDSDDEMEQRMQNCGFTNDEVNELLAQGVKPWDDDAWDVLEALRGD